MLLENYVNQLDRELVKYQKSVELVTSWLKRAAFHADYYIQQLIRRTIQELDQLEKEMHKSGREGLASLGRAIEEEKTSPDL